MYYRSEVMGANNTQTLCVIFIRQVATPACMIIDVATVVCMK